MAFALAACSRPVAPTVSVERVAVNRLDATGIGLDVVLTANNPNAVDLTLTGVSSHLVLDKTHDIGTVTVPKSVRLTAGTTTDVDVQVAMPWSDVGALAPRAALGGPMPYAVDGAVSFGGVLARVSLPFHAEGTIPATDLVKATVRALPTLHF
jgi:LEA14-like dessication related protein